MFHRKQFCLSGARSATSRSTGGGQTWSFDWPKTCLAVPVAFVLRSTQDALRRKIQNLATPLTSSPSSSNINRRPTEDLKRPFFIALTSTRATDTKKPGAKHSQLLPGDSGVISCIASQLVLLRLQINLLFATASRRKTGETVRTRFQLPRGGHNPNTNCTHHNIHQHKTHHF